MRVTVKKEVNTVKGKRSQYKWIFDCEAKPHAIFYTFMISIFIGIFIGYSIPTKWNNVILNKVLSTDCFMDVSSLQFPNSFKYGVKITSVKKLRKVSGNVLIAISLQQDYPSGVSEIHSSADTWARSCQNTSRADGTHCLYYVPEDWLPPENWVKSGQGEDIDKDIRQRVVRLEDVPQEEGNELKKGFVMLYHMYMQFSKRFDWFLIVPDKTYVQTDKLTMMLRTMDPEDILYLGNPSPNFGETHCEEHTGIVISRGLLKRLGPTLNQCVKRLKTLNFEKELNMCINNIIPIKCMKPDVFTFGHPKFGVGVTGRKRKYEFSKPTLSEISILSKSLTVKIPQDTNLFYYRLHKFIRMTESNKKRVSTLDFNEDAKEIDKLMVPNVGEEDQESMLYQLDMNGDELMWGNDIAATPWLRNGTKEWMKMETFGKTHMYVTMSVDSKPHRAIHGSWNLSLGRAKDLIIAHEAADVSEKSVINFRTLYTGVDVTSGLRYRFVMEEKKDLKYFMGFQNFLPLELNEYVNLTEIKGMERGRMTVPMDPYTSETFTSQNKQEHKIVFLITLSGRPDNLNRFLTNFNEVFLMRGHNVMLKLVLFEDENGELPINDPTIKKMIYEIRSEFGGDRVVIEKLEGSFSRGVGLQRGMDGMGEDDIVYFCDIDLVMNSEFLNRIRRNTIKGKQVLVNQYDPTRSTDYITPAGTYFDVNKERGYWRYYSYGMVSLYASDFFRTKGFELNIGGWGLEDLEFAEEVISNKIDIHRSADPGLIHVYHDKYCDPDLAPVQLNMCMATKLTHYADRSILYKMWHHREALTPKHEKENLTPMTPKSAILKRGLQSNIDVIQEDVVIQDVDTLKKGVKEKKKDTKPPVNKRKEDAVIQDVDTPKKEVQENKKATKPSQNKAKPKT